MLNFAEKHYRTCVEVILWLNLVSCVIAGYIIGDSFGKTCRLFSGCSGDGHPFLGAIIGLALGLVINILIGGFIAKILNIDANIEIMKDNSFRVESSKAETPKTETSKTGIWHP